MGSLPIFPPCAFPECQLPWWTHPLKTTLSSICLPFNCFFKKLLSRSYIDFLTLFICSWESSVCSLSCSRRCQGLSISAVLSLVSRTGKRWACRDVKVVCCVLLFVCVYICVHMHIYMCVCMHMCVCVCGVCLYVCMCVWCVYVCVCDVNGVCVPTWVFVVKFWFCIWEKICGISSFCL